MLLKWTTGDFTLDGDMIRTTQQFQGKIHQHLYEQLLRRYSCTKKLQSQTVTIEKLCKTLLYKKLRVKC